MSEPSEQSLAPAPQPAPAAAVLNTTARWLGIDEDIALGCESADPALQIDRWGQEVLRVPAG